MARDTLIKLRRGTGAPSSSTLNAGEPAVDTDTGRVYISTDGTDVVEVGSATASGNIAGNLTVGGNTQVDGTVNVDGNTTLNGVNNTGTIDTDTLTSTTVNSTTVTATGTVSGQFISSSGNISANGAIYASNYNPASLDTAYDRSPIGLSFSTTTGLLEIDRQGSPNLQVDLDGRYLLPTDGLQSGQISVGTFTPTFRDGVNGNAATFPNSLQEYGKYVCLKDSSGNTIASFITMFFSGGNTSGLNASNNVVIQDIPSAALTNYSNPNYGDPYTSLLPSWSGITQRSSGSQLATSWPTAPVSGMQIIDFDSTGGAPLAVNKFASGSFSFKIELMLI